MTLANSVAGEWLKGVLLSGLTDKEDVPVRYWQGPCPCGMLGQMRCIIVTLALIGVVALHAQGDSIYFPDKDKSHDISSAGAYGGVLPSDMADTVYFTGAATLKALQDVSFLAVGMRLQDLVIDLTEQTSGVGRKVQLKNTSTIFSMAEKDTEAELRGGLYDAVNGGTFYGANVANRKDGSCLTLSSGCVVTNVGVFTLAPNGATGVRFRLQDGSVFHWTKESYLVQGDTEGTNAIEVLSGSRLVFDSTSKLLSTDFNVMGQKPLMITINGQGSCFDVLGASYLYVGYHSPGHELRIEDGAKFHCASPIYVGYAAGASGSSLVVSGAMAGMDAGLDINYDVASSNNSVRVTNGGSLTCAKLRCGNAGDCGSVLVDDASLTCTTLQFGNNYLEQGFDGRLTVRGARARVESLGDATFYRRAKVVFELPPDGFACPPLEVAGNFVMQNDCELAVDVSAFKLGPQVQTLTLAEGKGTWFQIPTVVMAAANAALPAGFALSVLDKKLLLSVPKEKTGLILYIK